MSNDSHRAAARELAERYVRRGDPTGWFDVLYRRARAGAGAGGEAAVIPWADLRPNPHLVEWLDSAAPPTAAPTHVPTPVPVPTHVPAPAHVPPPAPAPPPARAHVPPPAPAPRRALVVGCGLGDDAELLASLGWSVVAFDISAEAIRWARERFPRSAVDYRAVDLFDAPPEWRRRFDLVVEAYTLQVLPPAPPPPPAPPLAPTPPLPSALRAQAIERIADWTAADGLLLLIARGRGESDPPGQMPWPLTEREVRAFATVAGLDCRTFEDYMDRDEPTVRRFRALFQRRFDEG